MDPYTYPSPMNDLDCNDAAALSSLPDYLSNELIYFCDMLIEIP